MNNTTETRGDVCIVSIGEAHLNASNSKAFSKDLAPLLQDNAKVVLDLEQVQFIDSTGLGAMVSSLRKLHSAGGEMKLCGVSKPVRALFELVRMHKVFDISN